MFKTKVMEDLDALLADLQSTTSHISTYQQSQQQPPPPPVADDDSRESTPPPLPPPPPQDVYDDLNDQPLYEPQRMKHQYHSSVSSTAVPRSHAATHQGPPPASFTPPPPPAHPPPPVGQPPLTSTPNTPPVPPPKPVKPAKPMSALSSNLTELDMLLQDLSSAQFMAEVDRRNAANVSNHGASDVQPIVPVASRRGDCSVDSLLIELENTAGRPLPSHQSMESLGSHYEAVRPVQQRNAQTLPQQAKAPGAASSATRELEDLMASLSEFKVTSQPQSTPLQHVGEPPYAQPNKIAKNAVQSINSASLVSGGAAQGGMAVDGAMPAAGGAQTHDNHLETMLGNLNTDMSRQGIMTIPKGHCAACTKPIVGQVITALGRIWHPEHFTCSHCKDELGTQNFFERDGLPYCERDYHNLFSPRCGHCNGPILDKCVTALDKTWHPEHFFCATCGRLFGEDGFHEKDGKAFCRDDYFEMFAPKCGGCCRPIMDNYISALSRQWHPECFICTDCHMPFGGGSFFDHEGMPYCETHYHAKRGSLCAGCHKPITGRCITAMYKKFHPEHFVCAFCLKQLNKGTFKEQNDKPYCHQCFVKLFG